MTGNVSEFTTYTIYRYTVPFDGTFTVETGSLTATDTGEWIRETTTTPAGSDPAEAPWRR